MVPKRDPDLFHAGRISFSLYHHLRGLGWVRRPVGEIRLDRSDRGGASDARRYSSSHLYSDLCVDRRNATSAVLFLEDFGNGVGGNSMVASGPDLSCVRGSCDVR